MMIFSSNGVFLHEYIYLECFLSKTCVRSLAIYGACVPNAGNRRAERHKWRDYERESDCYNSSRTHYSNSLGIGMLLHTLRGSLPGSSSTWLSLSKIIVARLSEV